MNILPAGTLVPTDQMSPIRAADPKDRTQLPSVLRATDHGEHQREAGEGALAQLGDSGGIYDKGFRWAGLLGNHETRRAQPGQSWCCPSVARQT